MHSANKETWSPEIQQRHLKWNYTILVADGATYTAGLAFVSQESVLPNMIRELGGPDWMVALSPALNFIGSMMTPLLVVHQVEKRNSYKNFTLLLSLVARTVPVLAALALLVGWLFCPGPSMWVAALSPLLIGLGGGLTTSGFWQLYGKLLPANRRSSNSAWRYSLGLLVGALAGLVISGVLHHYPGRVGYGILFLLQALGFAISGIFFSMLRERPDPPSAARPHREFSDVLRMIPQILREEKIFRRFMIARALGQSHFILIPFLALHFRSVMKLPESFLGSIVLAQMLGGLLGSLISGVWGDRHGSKSPIVLARIIMLLLCATVFWVSSPWMALSVFFGIGMVVNILNISEYNFVLDLTTPQNQPAMVAMQSLLLMPVSLGFGLLSRWLFSWDPSLALHGLVAGLFILVSLVYLKRIPDPRLRESAV